MLLLVGAMMDDSFILVASDEFLLGIAVSTHHPFLPEDIIEEKDTC